MDTDFPVSPTFVIKSLKMGDVSLTTLLERGLNYVNIKNNPDNPLQADSKNLIWYDIRDGVLEISTKFSTATRLWIGGADIE